MAKHPCIGVINILSSIDLEGTIIRMVVMIQCLRRQLKVCTYVRVVWCDVVWCGVVWCGVVWCGVVWCGVEWSRVVR